MISQGISRPTDWWVPRFEKRSVTEAMQHLVGVGVGVGSLVSLINTTLYSNSKPNPNLNHITKCLAALERIEIA